MLRAYKPPDWDSMLYDFAHWRIDRLGGWELRDIPDWMLISAWIELGTRYRQQANDYNHSAAWLMGAKMAQPKEAIEYKPWLPYQLDKNRYLPATVQAIINRLQDKLPSQMVHDLYNRKLMPLQG